MSTSTSTSWLDLGRRAFRGFLDLIYPPVCNLCGEALAEEADDLCDPCRRGLLSDFHSTCPRCAATVGPHSALTDRCLQCRDESFPFAAAVRLGPYAERWRDAVLRLKHGSGEGLAEALGRLWVRQAATSLKRLQAEVVVPVPLHWWRRFRRGYNQSEALARTLGRELGLPCRPRWLRRIRHTPLQTLQSPTARRENVRGAFRARRRPELAGRTILLVDDVMTTGSTCREAARALKSAGAGQVVVAVVARAEHGPQP